MKKLSKVLSLVSLVLILCLSLSPALAKENYTLAIGQFAEHPSLDNCREGFLQGLKDAGFTEGENLTVTVQNAQADMGTANMIASNFSSNSYDLICAIATPMAVCSFNASDDSIPVVYTAVAAPVEAGLSNEKGLGEGNITGTCDALPTALQLELIRKILPEAKKIGILYTIGEVNSKVQLEAYQAIAPEYGFEIEPMGITTGADVAMAVSTLVPQVDCLTMLTDNTVVQYLDVVLDETEAEGVPVFGSEIEQVINGCLAAQGLDYFKLGQQTGAMAARVLRGEKASDIPFETIRESSAYYNSEVAKEWGITLPEDVLAGGTDVSK